MRYDGGKGAMGVAQWIINQIPPHVTNDARARRFFKPEHGAPPQERLYICVIDRDGDCLVEWSRVGWPKLPEPVELHDYRYLGKNFRERERIKRKKNRWRSRFQKMSTLERRAVSAALAEVDDDIRSPIAENGANCRRQAA